MDQSPIELKKERIFEELRQLEEVKKVEYKEHEARINNLKKDIRILTEERAILDAACKKAVKEREKATESTTVYVKNELEAAEKEVGKIYAKATETLKTAERIEDKCKLKQDLVDIKEEELNKREKLLNDRYDENIRRKLELDKKEADFKTSEESRQKSIAMDEEKVDTLTREIARKEAKLKGLHITISINEKSNEEIELITKRIKKEQRILIAKQKVKEVELNFQEENITKREIAVKERERIASRAYREIINKGGIVYG